MNKSSLTISLDTLIFKPLPAHQEGGIGISFLLGFQSRTSRGFFMPSKFQKVMAVGCLGESSDSPHLVAVCQPNTVYRHPMIGIISGGLNPQILGVTAMNTQTTGEICPKSNQELLILAIQELGNIEQLCCEQATVWSVNTIFQHSQIALNALHDLKNALSMNEVASHE